MDESILPSFVSKHPIAESQLSVVKITKISENTFALRIILKKV